VRILFDATYVEGDDFDQWRHFFEFVADNRCMAFVQPLRNHGDCGSFNGFNGFMRRLRKEFDPGMLYNALETYDRRGILHCVPKLMLRIDHRGNLIYPCDKFYNCKAGNVLESDIESLWQRARAQHGAFPNNRCAGCGAICWWEMAHNFTHPLSKRVLLGQ
jgi:MoaA/NifB/PqqE/SkfB family radical SAM enzyme